MRAFAILAAVLLSGGAAIAGLELTLGTAAIDEALRLGTTRVESERTAFHRPYRIEVGRPPIDWIDIITPFRRIVLEAQTATVGGATLFGRREALERLGSSPESVAINVEMTFHPQNTFVGVPGYDVLLERLPRSPSERAVTIRAAESLDRVPRFGPRLELGGLPFPYDGARRALRGTEPLVGGVVIARFDGRALDGTGSYDLVVSDDGREIGRVRIELRAVR